MDWRFLRIRILKVWKPSELGGRRKRRRWRSICLRWASSLDVCDSASKRAWIAWVMAAISARLRALVVERESAVTGRLQRVYPPVFFQRAREAQPARGRDARDGRHQARLSHSFGKDRRRVQEPHVPPRGLMDQQRPRFRSRRAQSAGSAAFGLSTRRASSGFRAGMRGPRSAALARAS